MKRTTPARRTVAKARKKASADRASDRDMFLKAVQELSGKPAVAQAGKKGK
jgi:hypothetical protein